MTDQTTPTQAAVTPAPREVAQHWVTAIRDRDADALSDLYEVGAAMHTFDDVVLGHEPIAEALLAEPALPEADPEITTGREGMVTLSWDTTEGEPDESTRMRVRRGKIVEQWIGEHHSTTGRLAAVPMDMSVSGEVTTDEHDLVWETVDKLVSLRDEAVAHVDVRLSRQSEPSRANPVALRVTIALPGGSVRASTRAEDVRSAVTTVERRLRQALRQRADRRVHAREAEQSIRDGDQSVAERRPRRAPAEREVVRNKTVSPGPSTSEEAIFDLTSMGYDFFLYIDIDTDADALVARTDDGNFITYTAAPISSLESARDRLDAGNEPFVFFIDEQTQRGHVLYRRFDGHYGLIVPADE